MSTCWVCNDDKAWPPCPDGICFKCIAIGVECGAAGGRINPKTDCPDDCPQKEHWE